MSRSYTKRKNKTTTEASGGLSLLLLFTILLPVLGNGCGNSHDDQDAFANIHQWYLNIVAGISQPTFWTVVRLALILTLQTITCAIVFGYASGALSNSALMTWQWLACGTVFLLAAQLPLRGIALDANLRGFIFAVSLFTIAALPWRLSWLLVPKEGHRRLTAVVLYLLILCVLTIQSCRSL